MIMLLGPDGTGKTTLANVLEEQGYHYYHYQKADGYDDYLPCLVKLQYRDAVLDRFAFCERIYSQVMHRDFKFTSKEWHNLVFSTLIQKPLIILMVHKPSRSLYEESQYLPYELWDDCLKTYIDFLRDNHIPFKVFDYDPDPAFLESFGLVNDYTYQSIPELVTLERQYNHDIDWWVPSWFSGWGCSGSYNPELLIVAERIGPNNENNIPFEAGPTGQMLTDLLDRIHIPLGDLAITNYVKSFRRDQRPPNAEDDRLFRIELEHLQPKKVVFMGAVARNGIKACTDMGIPHEEVDHLGYFHHLTHTLAIPASYVRKWESLLGKSEEPEMVIYTELPYKETTDDIEQ